MAEKDQNGYYVPTITCTSNKHSIVIPRAAKADAVGKGQMIASIILDTLPPGPVHYAKKAFFSVWIACQGKPLGEKCIF